MPLFSVGPPWACVRLVYFRVLSNEIPVRACGVLNTLAMCHVVVVLLHTCLVPQFEAGGMNEVAKTAVPLSSDATAAR